MIVERVEARELRERNALVEHRIGLATEHLDRVAEVGQRLREVPRVDALSTDVRLTSVCEVREFQGLAGVQEPVVSP